MKKWFNNSLKFGCTACGKCCRGRNVFINNVEAVAIAEHLEISQTDFMRQYTEDRETSSGLLLTLKSTIDNSKSLKGAACIFLKENKCSIYDARPTQCRTYPFWPQIVMSELEWNVESKRCEGINRLDTEMSTEVNSQDVLRNLIVGQVHAKGTGPNWLYEDSLDILRDAEENEPNMIPDFEKEFFETHGSNVLMQNEELRVVESFIPGSEPATEDESENDSTSAAPSELVRYRRLEFLSSEHMSQSEVQVNSDGSINYDTLLFPVHRALACVALFCHAMSLKKGNALSATQLKPFRLALLGAGACALPGHLISAGRQDEQHQSQAVPVMIDAVEPSHSVLHAAQLHFGTEALTKDGSLRLHCTDGLSFMRDCVEALHTTADGPYDCIIVDAFESSQVTPSSSVRAPPASILSDPALLVALIKTHGLIAVNLWGDESWRRSVCALASTFKEFELPVLLRVGDEGNYVLILASKGGEPLLRLLVESLLEAAENSHLLSEITSFQSWVSPLRSDDKDGIEICSLIES